jgi:hypothetical protein
MRMTGLIGAVCEINPPGAGMKNKRPKDRTPSAEGRSPDSGKQKTPLNPAMEQPAGYHVGGAKMATLSEVLDSATPTLALAELTEQQQIDLTVARLQARPGEIKIAMIGPGVIDKNRAIAEVHARSKVGRTLVEIERMSLLNLFRQGGLE